MEPINLKLAEIFRISLGCCRHVVVVFKSCLMIQTVKQKLLPVFPSEVFFKLSVPVEIVVYVLVWIFSYWRTWRLQLEPKASDATTQVEIILSKPVCILLAKPLGRENYCKCHSRLRLELNATVVKIKIYKPVRKFTV